MKGLLFLFIGFCRRTVYPENAEIQPKDNLEGTKIQPKDDLEGTKIQPKDDLEGTKIQPEDIGKMDPNAANVIFSKFYFRPITSDGMTPATGVIYFTAVREILRILSDEKNEERLKKVIQDLTTSEEDTIKTEQEMKDRENIEKEVLKAMVELMKSLNKLLFEDPKGLEKIEQWKLPVAQYAEDTAELAAKEMAKGILGEDSTPGFMIRYKTGKYQEALSLARELTAESPILDLELMVPVWEFLGYTTLARCDVATYILLVIFCTRVRIIPYLLRHHFSVGG